MNPFDRVSNDGVYTPINIQGRGFMRNPGSVNHDGNTPLHDAAIAGDVRKIESILQQGQCHINCCRSTGETPLMLAAQAGQLNAVQCLLDHGANPDRIDLTTQTALHYATQREHNSEIVKLLIQKGSHVDAQTSNGITPLMNASRVGDDRSVALLLDNRAQPQLADMLGFTALHYAAERGDVKSIDLLLQAECGIDPKTHDGETPLLRAARGGHCDAFKLLLKNGANPCVTNEYQKMYLLDIISQNCTPEIISSVSEWLYNLYAKAIERGTPMKLLQVIPVAPRVFQQVATRMLGHGDQAQGKIYNEVLSQIISQSTSPAHICIFVRRSPDMIRKLSTDRTSALEVAFLLGDTNIAQAISEQLTDEQKKQEVRILCKKYPTCLKALKDIMGNESTLLDEFTNRTDVTNLNDVTFEIGKRKQQVQGNDDISMPVKHQRVSEQLDSGSASIVDISKEVPVLKSREAQAAEGTNAPVRICIYDRAQFDTLISSGTKHSQIDLKISKSDVTNEMIQEISNKLGTHIVSLDIQGCDSGVLRGSHFPNLKKLNVSNTGITDQVLRPFVAQSPHLTYLCVDNCAHVSFVEYQLKNLKILSAENTSINEFSLRQLIATCQELEWLSLNWSRDLDIVDFGFKKLQYLDISHCRHVADAALRSIAKESPDLRTLRIEGCSLARVEKGNFAQLEHLYAAGTSIKADGIKHLARVSPKLRTLSIDEKSLPMPVLEITQLNETWKSGLKIQLVPQENCGEDDISFSIE